MSEKPKYLESYKKLVGKAFEDQYIEDPDDIKIEKFSTGSTSLDIVLKGGYPKGKLTEFYGAEQSGKAQPLSSKILTPWGWSTMGEMQIGSVISTPDGGETTVIGVFPQGEQDVYEITFDDKSTARCTEDHLWYINTRGTTLGEVLTTRQLLDKGLLSGRTRKFRVPTVNPINYKETDSLPINPYLLGLLIGDGGLTTGGVTISTTDQEILERITTILEAEYSNVILSEKRGKCSYRFKKKDTSKNKNELELQLLELGLMNKYSYEKIIPKKYLYSSIENRIELLQGLMDSDGSVQSGTLSFSTSSLDLSNNIVELCRSLGMRCSTSSRTTKYTSKTGNKVDGRVSYRTSILLGTLEFMPFKLKRQIDRFNPIRNIHSERFIESIVKVGREECQCIAVGSPDKLYITDNFIVTHNTTACIEGAAQFQKAYPNSQILWIDLEDTFDAYYCRKIGLDTKKNFQVFRPHTGEQAYELMKMFAQNEKNGLLILDSVALLLPEAEDEGDMGKAVMGSQARLNSQGMRKLFPHSRVSSTTMFFINQTRDKLGVMFGNPTTTPGGNAIKFYARTRLEFSKAQGEKDADGNFISNKTSIKTEKANFGYPRQKVDIYIKFGEGFDREKEVIDVATELGIIEKSGSWYSYNGSKLGQGSDAVKALLTDNIELMEEIESKIKERMVFEK